MTFGGGEANVAVSLALLGDEATFVTRLPKNDVAEACIQRCAGSASIRGTILRGGERIGIYFLESGASQRASTVTYDRAHSAISEIDPAELKWDDILRAPTGFILPASRRRCPTRRRRRALDGANAAKKLGLTVSCDLNFRKKLWSSEKAGKVMGGLMEHVDICIANEEDAEKVFGIKAAGTEVTEGKIDHDRYVDVAKKLTERFKFKGVAITLRESFSASHNGWSGLYLHRRQGPFQPPLRHPDRRPRRRRRFVCCGADLRAGQKKIGRGGDPIRRGGKLPEALDQWRSQPRSALRSRSAAGGRRLGTGATLNRLIRA